MSRRIILNTLLYLYISAGRPSEIVFTTFVAKDLQKVLMEIMTNGYNVNRTEAPQEFDSFCQIAATYGTHRFILCGKAIPRESEGFELKIANVNFQELKDLYKQGRFEEYDFQALEEILIDMPAEIDPQSPYVLRDWLYFPGDLKGADWRKLEGNNEIETLDAIFNKDMEALPQGDADQPGLFKVRIFTTNVAEFLYLEEKSHFDVAVRVNEDGSLSFMDLDQERQRGIKRDLAMLKSTDNLTEKARARAIKRIKGNTEYEIIDGKISINKFHSQFEIKNYEPGLTKPVPNFFEGLKISRVYNRKRAQGINLILFCRFIFQQSYLGNPPKGQDIDEFEMAQTAYWGPTDEWPDCFFCVDFQEKTLYLRYNSLRELEVLDPNNGNLNKLRQVLEKTIDGSALKVSDFWIPCPTTLEEAVSFLFNLSASIAQD